ncbi:hypothetical protein ABZY16_33240 [Streptomyces sp. NPDC006553]|uniref:hypothetical protein n=1 Tax=Streptomyces sp. NPDC006553 TaxID=3157180 RepID=UPI0033B854AD
MDPATARSIEVATALPAATLAVVWDDAVDRWSTGGREASRATRVSASENSAISYAVRSALRSRVELDAFRSGLLSDSIAACGISARAVCKRAKLTEAQYAVLVEPFRAVGVEVPARGTYADTGA